MHTWERPDVNQPSHGPASARAGPGGLIIIRDRMVQAWVNKATSRQNNANTINKCHTTNNTHETTNDNNNSNNNNHNYIYIYIYMYIYKYIYT